MNRPSHSKQADYAEGQQQELQTQDRAHLGARTVPARVEPLHVVEHPRQRGQRLPEGFTQVSKVTPSNGLLALCARYINHGSHPPVAGTSVYYAGPPRKGCRPTLPPN